MNARLDAALRVPHDDPPASIGATACLPCGVGPSGPAPATTRATRNSARTAGIGLLGLCAAWILFGLVGHDPWKADEAYTFGIVFELLKHGDWVVPTLAGEPFLEKPPLFFITAAVFAKALGGILPLHDAARLASGFYVALALGFLGLTATELNGGRRGFTAALIMMGCLGLIANIHQLVTDLAQFAGISIGVYGLARCRRSVLAGGAALGIGAAIAFLSKGLLGPGFLGLSAFVLPLLGSWRHRGYTRALGVAAIVGSPAIVGWMVALYARSPDMFHTWLVTNNFGRFFGFVSIGPQVEPFSYPKMLAWYAFPALPIAGWTLWNSLRNLRHAWSQPAIQLPAIVAAVMLTVLGAAHDARALYLMPTLLPLTLLGVAGMDSLPPRATNALANVGYWLWGGAALLLWFAWWALLVGKPAVLARPLLEYQPGFEPEFRAAPFGIALAVTLLWFRTVRRAYEDPLHGVLQWAAGMTLFWALIATLWLPFLDAGKSYRTMIASLVRSLPEGTCVRSRALGEPQRAMLDYLANIVTIRDELTPDAPCKALLVQGWRNTGAPAPEPGWTAVWEGARPGDFSELYRLYIRGGTTERSLRRFPG